MQDRTDQPDPNVRHDIGGWISGPSLDEPLPDPDEEDELEAMLRAAGADWQISRPLGLWGALWRSDDGRHTRYLVAPTAAELAEKIARVEGAAS
jgi:hypothetical protein